MQSELSFRVLLVILLVAFVAHRGYYHKKCRPLANGAAATEQGKLIPTSTTVIGVLGLLATIAYVVNPRLVAWSALPVPEWLRWMGVPLALVGFILLHWAQRALGRNWSDSPRLLKAQTLVMAGPYRAIRHPIYTAFLLILAAPFLLSANWFIGSMWLAMTSLEVFSRIRVEEALMISHFGEEYRRYKAVTGRLLPRLSRPKRGRTL